MCSMTSSSSTSYLMCSMTTLSRTLYLMCSMTTSSSTSSFPSLMSSMSCKSKKPRKVRQKKKKKIGGGSCPPGKCFFLGGGKCPNLGVGNVRILGVVNVRLANNLTPPRGPRGQTLRPKLSCFGGFQAPPSSDQSELHHTIQNMGLTSNLDLNFFVHILPFHPRPVVPSLKSLQIFHTGSEAGLRPESEEIFETSLCFGFLLGEPLQQTLHL